MDGCCFRRQAYNDTLVFAEVAVEAEVNALKFKVQPLPLALSLSAHAYEQTTRSRTSVLFSCYDTHLRASTTAYRTAIWRTRSRFA